ncbi:hypothetical protein BDY24DRAFT_72654 [Mrakia frigida]|uniref:uncharacterized protein n=1 Tax=Mrakia frigida TaxID=29902 RepID=UPI003FCC16EB
MTSSTKSQAVEAAPFVFTPVKQVKGGARKDIEYSLKFRQQPRQARMCGEGEKGDRRPIDPPPIIQLNVVHRPLKEAGSKANSAAPSEDDPMGERLGATAQEKGKGKAKESGLEEEPVAVAGQSYLQNPYYFMSVFFFPFLPLFFFIFFSPVRRAPESLPPPLQPSLSLLRKQTGTLLSLQHLSLKNIFTSSRTERPGTRLARLCRPFSNSRTSTTPMLASSSSPIWG